MGCCLRDIALGYDHTSTIGERLPLSRRRYCRQRDDDLSRARFAFDWQEQFRLSLDPDRAKEYYEESRKNAACPNPDGGTEKYCTMCGPKFCAMKTTQELKQLLHH